MGSHDVRTTDVSGTLTGFLNGAAYVVDSGIVHDFSHSVDRLQVIGYRLRALSLLPRVLFGILFAFSEMSETKGEDGDDDLDNFYPIDLGFVRVGTR